MNVKFYGKYFFDVASVVFSDRGGYEKLGVDDKNSRPYREPNYEPRSRG